MKISIKWIMEILGADLDPAATAEKLTMSGSEVEEIDHVKAPDPRIIVADIVEAAPHPSSRRSELKVVGVWDGKRQVQVVCGAPNTPGKGARVVFAGEGVEIKGVKLAPRDFDGVRSTGMLCSEEELGIGPDESGIIVLEENVKAGTPLASAFDLEDWIFDISVTPNRGDMLGHIGAAREIAALHGIPFPAPGIPSDYEESDEDPSKLVRIVIEDPEGCPRYTAAVVRGVEIGPSPLKMRSRLLHLGVRPISNAVDITNWILLLHNQPLHAFDLKRLSGGQIIVRRARPNERIITLDGIERILDGKDLVIADKASPVAVAGIMGGEGSGIEEYTKDILIECAYFSPMTIRRTSSKLNLSSESSYRFERGIDPSNQLHALKEATRMMCLLMGGKAAGGLLDIHPKPHVPLAVSVRGKRVEKILGAKLDWDESLAALSRLGCGVKKEGAEALVTIPPFRPDLTREIDLIEEIARIAGYDRIPSTSPVIQVSAPERSSYDLVKSIRTQMASGGFTEAVNLSLVGFEKQQKYFPGREPVRIDNPLTSERDVMRLSLVPGLLDNLVHALTWKERSVRLFEVGTVFRPGDGGLVEGIVERTHAAAIAFGPRPGWIGEKRGEADFFDVMGLLEHLCEGLWNCPPALEKGGDGLPAFLLPASAVRVSILGRECGWVGELHPELYHWLDLPRSKSDSEKVGLMEIDVPDARPAARRFRPIPTLPTAERDIAMIFDEPAPAAKIIDVIRAAGGELLESVELFDIYRGKGIGEGKKSMAFSLVFRSKQATLKTEEIDALHKAIIAALEKEFAARLR
jgi:phenylalanyl-tRNA synthetase beta chain